MNTKIIALIAANVLYSCLAISQVSPIERAALIALYTSTGGDNWTNNSNWDTDVNSNSDISSWYGVTVEEDKVVEISLYNNNLVGAIPSQISNLTELNTLDLGYNQLTATIPTSISNLTLLTELYLDDNQLSGTIPDSIGNLSALNYLYLAGNQLTGNIPTSIGNLSALEELFLNQNELTGNIPSSIGNLSNLLYLYLDNNQLSGTIPTSIGNLSALEELDLGENILSISSPSTFDGLINLDYLHLDDNQFAGTLILNSLNKLNSIALNDNDFTQIYFQNNHNDIVVSFNTINNPNLSCIFVDNSSYSQSNWTNIDASSSFVESEAACEASFPCSISAITTDNLSECNDNGTPNDPSDDTFTADITVTFDYQPSTGLLILDGDANSSVDVSNLNTNSYTFTNISMAADGTPIALNAAFSDNTDCAFSTTDAGIAPQNCSFPCSISAITTDNLSECNDNGTPNDPSDDTFTADITVTFDYQPSTGLLIIDGDANSSVELSNLNTNYYTFTNISMAADGTPIALNAAFSDNTDCAFSTTDAGTAPRNCITVSANNLNLSNKLSVYPNPSTHYVSVSGLSDLSHYIIYNASAQIVMRGELKTEQVIDIRDLTKGIYLLKLDGYRKAIRFVKN